MSAMHEVACINVKDRIAITEDGQVLPITDAFGPDGEDCDLAEAVTCVAGPDADGMWLTIDFAEWEKVPVQ